MSLQKGHSAVLIHLAYEYLVPRGVLFAAFMGLKAAFDSVARRHLWEKLMAMSIKIIAFYSLFMFFIWINIVYSCSLYFTQAHCSFKGQLSEKFRLIKSVKEGCILAPLIFNLYLKDLPGILKGCQFFPPILTKQFISVLLYADDVLFLPRPNAGFKNLMKPIFTLWSLEVNLGCQVPLSHQQGMGGGGG